MGKVTTSCLEPFVTLVTAEAIELCVTGESIRTELTSRADDGTFRGVSCSVPEFAGCQMPVRFRRTRHLDARESGRHSCPGMCHRYQVSYINTQPECAGRMKKAPSITMTNGALSTWTEDQQSGHSPQPQYSKCSFRSGNSIKLFHAVTIDSEMFLHDLASR